jgi:Ca-activated chloride channel family protein
MTTDTLTRAQLRSRHRARKSRHRARTVAGLATLLILVVGTSGLAWWGYQARGAVSCAGSPVTLRVAASSSVADAVQEEARAFEQTKPQVGDACVSVDVVAMDVPKVNAALVSAASLRRDPGFDVWVPESATWAKVLSRRPEVDRLLPDVFSVLASSPVVAAMPEPMAKSLGWPQRQAELDQLVALAQDPAGWAKFGHPEWGRVRVAWQDPQKSTAGLDGLMTLFAKLDSGTDADQLRVGMLRVQNALTNLDLDESKALEPLADPQLSSDEALKASMITPSTEREVRAFNASGPREKLAPVTVGVSGAAAKVGYLPLYGTSLDRTRAMTAAESFRQFLTSTDGSRAFARAGWRIPTGESGTETGPATVGSGDAVREVKPATLELSQPTLQSITRALQSWSALERTGSVLLAVDVSGSMKEQVPRLGMTRLQLAQKALTSAIVSTSDRSSIGLWEFSRHLKGDKDYHVVVPLGAASDAVGGGTRRDAVRVGISKLTARGDTGLYDTALAAVRDVRSKWRADQDVVVILSDGRNDDPGSISLKALVAALKKEQDPDKPVRVYTVAYGAQADAAALSAIAKATGGQSFVASSPADIERVLLASLSE